MPETHCFSEIRWFSEMASTAFCDSLNLVCVFSCIPKPGFCYFVSVGMFLCLYLSPAYAKDCVLVWNLGDNNSCIKLNVCVKWNLYRNDTWLDFWHEQVDSWWATELADKSWLAIGFSAGYSWKGSCLLESPSAGHHFWNLPVQSLLRPWLLGSTPDIHCRWDVGSQLLHSLQLHEQLVAVCYQCTMRRTSKG